jgi:hypothetical protein
MGIRSHHLFIIVLALTVSSCGKKKAPVKAKPLPDNGATYFSIKQFIQDQWDYYQGEPIIFTKLVTTDDKRDSSLISGFKMELGWIMETFVKTDISDRRFLDKYDFEMVDDAVSFTRSYYYEAKDPAELYTKKLQIITNPENNKIRSIYVEAGDTAGWTKKSVKLYYAPGKIIQMQETVKSRYMAAEETKTEYRFPETDSYY